MYSGCCYCYLSFYYFLPLQQRWLLDNTLLYIIWKVMIHHGCSIKVFRGTPVSWLITSGYCRVFFRMSDIKFLWLTDPLWQDGRSGGCMALWTVSSSSSLMSWVALTASPGHSMYMCFLNICWWTYPIMNTASWGALGLAGKGFLVVQCPAGPENRWSRKTLLANSPWLESQC